MNSWNKGKEARYGSKKKGGTPKSYLLEKKHKPLDSLASPLNI